MRRMCIQNKRLKTNLKVETLCAISEVRRFLVNIKVGRRLFWSAIASRCWVSNIVSISLPEISFDREP